METIRVSQNLILLPVLLQVALTIGVLFAMGAARQTSMRARRQSIQDMALAANDDWDEKAIKTSNNFKNQFELPVLFYVLCAFALITRFVDAWMLALALAFVVTRYGHAIVHLTSNVVLWRGTFYLVGLALLIAMWVLLAWRVAVAGW